MCMLSYILHLFYTKRQLNVHFMQRTYITSKVFQEAGTVDELYPLPRLWYTKYIVKSKNISVKIICAACRAWELYGWKCQKVEKQVQYLCSKTRACNDNNTCNPTIKKRVTHVVFVACPHAAHIMHLFLWHCHPYTLLFFFLLCTRLQIQKCKKHFIKMLKDVGMVVPKMKETRL